MFDVEYASCSSSSVFVLLFLNQFVFHVRFCLFVLSLRHIGHSAFCSLIMSKLWNSDVWKMTIDIFSLGSCNAMRICFPVVVE